MMTMRMSGAGILVGCGLAALMASAAVPQSPTSPPAPRVPQPLSPYSAASTSVRAGNYYLMHWGVDSLVVKMVPSDQLIRFSYRVVDASKAKVLNAKESAPELFDELSHVSLVVPTMDKVGQLRQSGAPENGKTYWMVFSNKGNVVKRGHRVGIVIGAFKANGLAVE
jgi:hypothetical protein